MKKFSSLKFVIENTFCCSENRLNPQSHSDGPSSTWWELHFGRPSTESFALCKAVLASKYFSIEFYLGQFDVVSVQCRTELQF